MNDDEPPQRQIEILSTWTRSLRSELDRMREINLRLRRQLSTSNTGVQADEEENRHKHLSLRFANLLQQSCRRLVAISLAGTGEPADAERIAIELSRVARILLSEPASPAGLCRHLGLDPGTYGPEIGELLVRIAAVAGRLPNAQWDFRATIGAPLDARRQAPWETCDPGAPVKFVVTPSWRSGHRVHIRQTVYTD